MRTRSVRLVPALLLCALPLAACGSDSDDDSGSGEAGQEKLIQRTNPVDVLKKIEGCEIEPGVTVGEEDINGNRYASCEISLPSSDDGWLHSITVLVRSVGQDPATLDDSYQDDEGDDTTRIIHGSDFYVRLSTSEAATMAGFDAEAVAAQVGGELQPVS